MLANKLITGLLSSSRRTNNLVITPNQIIFFTNKKCLKFLLKGDNLNIKITRAVLDRFHDSSIPPRKCAKSSESVPKLEKVWIIAILAVQMLFYVVQMIFLVCLTNFLVCRKFFLEVSLRTACCCQK